MGAGVGASQRIPFVCFGAKPTQRACARDFPRDQKKADNRREQKRGSRQNWAVDRTGQSAIESSRQKSGEADGREKRLLRPVNLKARLANIRG